MPDKKEEKPSAKGPPRKAYKSSSRRLLNIGYFFVGGLVLLSMVLSLVLVGGGGASEPPTPTPFPPVALEDLKLDGAPVKGSAEAPIRIVHFGDFQSSGDRAFVEATQKTLEEKYISSNALQIVWKDYPRLSPPPALTPQAVPTVDESTLAAHAARCANDQQKFWEYHGMLFKNQGAAPNSGAFSRDNLIKFAGELGLDSAVFTTCLSDASKSQAIQQDAQDSSKIGVVNTPSFSLIVGNVVLPFQEFGSIIPFDLGLQFWDTTIDEIIKQLQEPPLTPGGPTPTPRISTPLPEATSIPPRTPTPTPMGGFPVPTATPSPR